VPGIIAVVRLLVIGATGYVGRHVVCHASAAGLDVSGTSRSSDGAEASLDVTVSRPSAPLQGRYDPT
jgi:nucleoside-diphosphate-sugar epimerase